MDTVKDRDVLRKLWDNGYAPWHNMNITRCEVMKDAE